MMAPHQVEGPADRACRDGPGSGSSNAVELTISANSRLWPRCNEQPQPVSPSPLLATGDPSTALMTSGETRPAAGSRRPGTKRSSATAMTAADGHTECIGDRVALFVRLDVLDDRPCGSEVTSGATRRRSATRSSRRRQSSASSTRPALTESYCSSSTMLADAGAVGRAVLTVEDACNV